MPAAGVWGAVSEDGLLHALPGLLVQLLLRQALGAHLEARAGNRILATVERLAVLVDDPVARLLRLGDVISRDPASHRRLCRWARAPGGAQDDCEQSQAVAAADHGPFSLLDNPFQSCF